MVIRVAYLANVLMLTDYKKHLMILLVLFAAPAIAQEKGPTVTLLIENVHLVSSEPGGDEPLLNLVIRDRKLDIVTKDAVPVEEFTLTFDAQGKYLVGQLSLGESPSFIIVDEDPRQDFDVLLDTKEHVYLAIKDGDVVQNRLGVAAETPESQSAERPKATWLAYNPPPLAMPSGYQDKTKWNRWDTKAISGLFTKIPKIQLT